MAMSAAGPRPPGTHAPPRPWPAPSATIMKRWASRHIIYLQRSVGYTKTQERMLFLADLQAAERFSTFEAACLTRGLAPSTAATYWVAWLSAQQALELPSTAADKAILRRLEARASQYPPAFPLPMSLHSMTALRSMYATMLPRTLAAIGLAFVCGQRISDVIQLAARDFQVVDNGDLALLVATVRRGKVMSMIHPYPIAVPRNSWIAVTLIAEITAATDAQRLFVFTATNDPRERAAELSRIASMLTSVDEQLELRSVRRGGLTRMASMGFPLDKILLFSQHRDPQMLRRYLNWGVSSTATLTDLHQITEAMTTPTMA